MRNSKSYIGAGINASSIYIAIRNAQRYPSKQTIPAGATWPFAHVSITSSSVSFRMAHIVKKIPKNGGLISLSKLGYICFSDGNNTNDFAFLILRPMRLLSELEKRGYKLDITCQKNLKIAQILIIVLAVIPFILFIATSIFGILAPRGV